MLHVNCVPAQHRENQCTVKKAGLLTACQGHLFSQLVCVIGVVEVVVQVVSEDTRPWLGNILA